MSKIYAIDFDGTLCQKRWPDIGEPIKEVVEFVKELRNNGDRLILWTCREGESLEEAIKWCGEQGIEFDAINQNIETEKEKYGADTRKIGADFYVDDKAVNVSEIIERKEDKMAIKKYYSLAKNGNTIDVYIYGDITSWPWVESDVSSYGLAKELELLEAEQINCYINSYGGEVAEGLAIYNQLKRHPAKVTTICDGFACSAASVIFMAGDERLMGEASLLMIHNAWTYTSGNSEELRKQADDLDTITQASINAYMACVNIEEAALKELLDKETWILPADAVAMDFATGIAKEETGLQASQSIKQKVVKMLAQKAASPVFKIDLSDNVKQALGDLKKEMQEQLDEIKKQACRSNVPESEEKVPETTENVPETDGKVPEPQEEGSNLLKSLVAALSQKG